MTPPATLVVLCMGMHVADWLQSSTIITKDRCQHLIRAGIPGGLPDIDTYVPPSATEPGHIGKLNRKTLPPTSRRMLVGFPLYRKKPIPRGLVSSNDLPYHI